MERQRVRGLDRAAARLEESLEGRRDHRCHGLCAALAAVAAALTVRSISTRATLAHARLLGQPRLSPHACWDAPVKDRNGNNSLDRPVGLGLRRR